MSIYDEKLGYVCRVCNQPIKVGDIVLKNSFHNECYLNYDETVVYKYKVGQTVHIINLTVDIKQLAYLELNASLYMHRKLNKQGIVTDMGFLKYMNNLEKGYYISIANTRTRTLVFESEICSDDELKYPLQEKEPLYNWLKLR